MLNPYVDTYSGRKVFLLNPTADSIDITDIAWALSKICRYTGHTASFYSVAQHSYHVSQFVPPECRLWGLLHDSTEAYLGDVNAPLKSLLESYRRIEHNMMMVIGQKFGLEGEQPEIVKYIDTCMLFNETEVLLPKTRVEEWNLKGERVIGLNIRPWTVYESYQCFLDRFYYLTGQYER